MRHSALLFSIVLLSLGPRLQAQPPAPGNALRLPAPDPEMLNRLNKTTGTFTFEGSLEEGADEVEITGRLTVTGSSTQGMLPAWRLIWEWPAETPTYRISDAIMIMPHHEKVDLRLLRSVHHLDTQKNEGRPGVSNSQFTGTWQKESNSIRWTEVIKNPDPNRASHPMSFEMKLHENGMVELLNSGRMHENHLIKAKAIQRTP